MPNMTLSISQEMYDKMKNYSEIRWSEVARKAFAEKINHMEMLDDLKEVTQARKEYKEGKGIKFSDLKKEMGRI
ncbi:MAG TPA: hypothetical protein PK655_00235 [archaeon]|jgi:phosphoribosylaminoimidazole-succinocarboxamide synthase|nr:hypothetical protein [archaeon]HPV65872.1 hypothetical protein [archaeon]HRS42497.1 hypothetical protein [Candidatus Diapherotrites archaeon]